MTMIEHIVSIVVAALLLQGSYESWMAMALFEAGRISQS